MPGPHIQVLPNNNNNNGNDYVTTDIHGCVNLLEKIMAQLTENDRLFICGDVVDRGPESLAVIRKIRDHNALHAGQINVIRGNHEDLALRAITFIRLNALLKTLANLETRNSTLETMSEKDALEKNTTLETINLLCKKNNTIRLLFNNITSAEYNRILKKFSAINNKASTRSIDYENQYFNNILRSKKCSSDENDFFMDYVGSISQGGSWLLSLNCDEQNEVTDFIESLPYIIRTDKQFVHADMPLSDSQVLENTVLSDKQIDYCTWARKEGSHQVINESENKRTNTSRLTFCGHSPHEDRVRKSTNTINLDMDSPNTHRCLLINANRGSVQIIEDRTLLNNVSSVDSIIDEYATKIAALTIEEFLITKPQNYQSPANKITEKFTQDLNNYILAECNGSYTSEKYLGQLREIRNSLTHEQSEIFLEYLRNKSDPVATSVYNSIVAEDMEELNNKILKLCNGRYSRYSRYNSLPHHIHNKKKLYLDELKINIVNKTPKFREAFALFLLNQKDHLLAKERDHTEYPMFFSYRESHSNETRSMHTAIKLLLQDSPNNLIIERGCFTHKLTIKKTEDDSSPIILNRFGH